MSAVPAILVAALLTNNFVLSKFLGICPFLGVSKQLKTAVSMSLAVILVMVMATAATWPIYNYVLDPAGLGYLQTIVFIIIIAVLVQLLEMVMKKAMPPLYRSLGIYLPLITTNCAVLGVTILNISENYSYVQSLFNSFGSGLGFLMAMAMFAGVRMKMENSDVPKALRGLPITLIAAAITSLSMMGFAGIAEGLFGK